MLNGLWSIWYFLLTDGSNENEEKWNLNIFKRQNYTVIECCPKSDLFKNIVEKNHSKCENLQHNFQFSGKIVFCQLYLFW